MQVIVIYITCRGWFYTPCAACVMPHNIYCMCYGGFLAEYMWVLLPPPTLPPLYDDCESSLKLIACTLCTVCLSVVFCDYFCVMIKTIQWLFLSISMTETDVISFLTYECSLQFINCLRMLWLKLTVESVFWWSGYYVHFHKEERKLLFTDFLIVITEVDLKYCDRNWLFIDRLWRPWLKPSVQWLFSCIVMELTVIDLISSGLIIIEADSLVTIFECHN